METAKSTDKYYDEKLHEAAQLAATEIMKALNYDSEKRDICMEDINAMSRFLVYERENRDSTGYETVVDFLWMSYRISLNAKHLLLDLLEEEA